MVKFFKKKKHHKKITIISVGIIFLFSVILIAIFVLSNNNLPNQEIEYFGQEPKIKDVSLDKPLVPLNQEINNKLELRDNLLELKEQNLNDQALAAFLNDSFSFYEYNSLTALSPEDFYQARSGSAVDLAVFVADVLSPQVVAVGVLRFDYYDKNKNKKEHAVAIYRDKELPKYITLGQDNFVEIYHHGWSFTELIAAEEVRLGVAIERYAYFPEGILDLSEPKYPYEWQFVR